VAVDGSFLPIRVCAYTAFGTKIGLPWVKWSKEGWGLGEVEISQGIGRPGVWSGGARPAGQTPSAAAIVCGIERHAWLL
jgi:hypothetical protein